MNLVIRWNPDARREEYWDGESWSDQEDDAQMIDNREAREVAKDVDGQVRDWDQFFDG